MEKINNISYNTFVIYMDYSIKKYIDKIKRGESSGFLDPLELKQVTSKLKKNEYNIYSVYEESDKKILYKNNLPVVKLYKINSYEKLKHQEIMGSLYSLSIDKSMIGDIIIDEDEYYFYVIDKMSSYIENSLFMIGNKYVTIEEIDIGTLENYKKKYEKNNIIVPSLRMDAIVAKITNTSRSNSLELIKNKNVILNYSILKDGSTYLKENDVFSIRRYGKYKFSKIIKNTKKDNIIIEYYKYI